MAALSGLLAVLATGSATGGTKAETERLELRHGWQLQWDRTPHGRGLVLEAPTVARISDHPSLRWDEQGTLDLWLRMSEPAAGRNQFVIDKAGERYRLHVRADGSLHFGVKSRNARADVSGGTLRPGQWHRVTGVFDRPRVELYLDGEKIGHATLDEPIAPGGDLYIGSKRGDGDFLDGTVAALHISRAAVRPTDDDATPAELDQVDVFQRLHHKALADKHFPQRLEVEADDEQIRVDNGAMRIRLGRGDRATLQSIEKAGQQVVANNTEPLLAATLMQSEAYHPAVDYVPDATFLPGDYHVDEVRYERDDHTFTAELIGRLRFDDEDAIGFTLTLTLRAAQPHIETAVRVSPLGPFRDRYLRELKVVMPLALHWRKRVAQGGDRGMSWDTRYYYEFIRWMPMDPDRNEWRHFAVQQTSPEHFRIWRAESEQTPPLVAQHGRHAPGWTSVYDRQGGVLAGYRDISERSPKTLWVNAAGGGEMQIHLHGPTEPAARMPAEDDGTAPVDAADHVFGQPHHIDWVFYEDEHPVARPEDYLAELWQRPQPFAGRRPRDVAELTADEPDLLDAPVDDTHALNAYLHGGVPFARSELTTDDHIEVRRDGQRLPVQHRPLAYWPDGSIKWLHLVLAPLADADAPDADADAADAVRGTTTFDVSFRDERRVAFTLGYGERIVPLQPAQPVEVNQADQRVHVDTGPLQVELTTGTQWLRQAHLHGRPMLDHRDDDALAFVDYLRVQEPYATASTHPAGEPDPGDVRIDTIDVEEAGPLRAVLRLEGESTGREPARVILRLKFHADRSWVQLFHTIEFRHADPNTAFLRRMGLRLPLPPDADTTRVTAGVQDGPLVRDAAAGYTGLHQHSHDHYRLIGLAEDSDAGRLQAVHQGRRSRGWLDVADGRRGVAVVLRDMWQAHPKAIVHNGDHNTLSTYLWPASEPLMDVRRYSRYPHHAQGESAGRSNDWVERVYDQNEPFAGIARTHQMAIVFHDGTLDPHRIDAIAADVQSPPLIYSGFDRYRDTAISLKLPDYQNFPRISRNMTSFTDFWLFHQRLYNWYGIWDHGDIQHRFRGGGYGNFVDPEYLKQLMDVPEDQTVRSLDRRHTFSDYVPQQDWAFDNGRWGWTNTEGLPALYLKNEYLRTGRRDVFFAAEAMARHSRDVVTRHHGRWFGRGTRHGVQHWSDGNHEERQTVFSEIRLHHYLTGEGRTRDVMARLADTYYARGSVSRHADHSARIYGLVTRWEMTGDPAMGRIVRDYVRSLIVPEGIAASAAVRFTDDGVELRDARRDINTSSMFFHTFGAMHGLLEYHRITRDDELRAALIRMVDALIEEGPAMTRHAKVIAFAARHGHEPAAERLRQWIEQEDGWRHLFQMVSTEPAHWSGDTAFMRTNIPVSLFVMNNLPTIMTALDREPTLTDRQQQRLGRDNSVTDQDRAIMDAADRRGFREKPRLRWQHAYDDPELQHFFGPFRPPETQSR